MEGMNMQPEEDNSSEDTGMEGMNMSAEDDVEMSGMSNMEGMGEMQMGDELMCPSRMNMDMGGMEMEMMMGMGGSAPEAKPQPPEVKAARRMINYVLKQVHLGVTGSVNAGMPAGNAGGLLASVPDEKQAVVQKWVEDMQPIIEAINDKMLDDRAKFVEGLTAQIEELKLIVGVDEPAAEGLPGELQPAEVDPLAGADPLGAG